MLKTKLEIIEETAKFYAEDPSRRGLDSEGLCQYYSDGKQCAVGRCLLHPENFESSDATAKALIKEYGYDLFKPEYRVEDSSFWFILQRFHDRTYNWNKYGLTQDGKDFLEELKQKYA